MSFANIIDAKLAVTPTLLWLCAKLIKSPYLLKISTKKEKKLLEEIKEIKNENKREEIENAIKMNCHTEKYISQEIQERIELEKRKKSFSITGLKLLY